MKSKIIDKINSIPNKYYIFWTTLSFNLLLLIVNPGNKIIAVSFALLFIAYYLKTKDFVKSILFTFISSMIIMTGKTYPTQIMPPGTFDLEAYPQGYFIKIVITASDIIAFIMFVCSLRQILLNKLINFSINDLLIFLYFIFKTLSAILGSNNSSLSLPLEILGLGSIFIYFFNKTAIKLSKDLWNTLIYLISALVIFESILCIGQLKTKSPLGKSVEYQTGIEYYGNTIGETKFTFRPVGTFDHANSFGIWLSAICILLLAYLIENKSNIVALAFLFGSFSLTTTLSRSAWIGFITGLILLSLSFSNKIRPKIYPLIKLIIKWRLIILPILLILIIFFIIPRINDTLYSFDPTAGGYFFRKIQISDTLELVKLHPIFGIGAGMAANEGVALDLYTLAAKVPLEVHNWYLSTALSNGIPALFLIITFIVYSLKSLYKSRNHSIYYSITATIITSLIAGLFQPYLNFKLIILLLSIANGGNISHSINKHAN